MCKIKKQDSLNDTISLYLYGNDIYKTCVQHKPVYTTASNKFVYPGKSQYCTWIEQLNS